MAPRYSPGGPVPKIGVDPGVEHTGATVTRLRRSCGCHVQLGHYCHRPVGDMRVSELWNAFANLLAGRFSTRFLAAWSLTVAAFGLAMSLWAGAYVLAALWAAWLSVLVVLSAWRR